MVPCRVNPFLERFTWSAGHAPSQGMVPLRNEPVLDDDPKGGEEARARLQKPAAVAAFSAERTSE
jgi:hypothetical protein